MKKFLSVLAALLLVLCSAFSEESAVKPEGTWYVNQVIIGEESYDVSLSSNRTVVELQADNTGVVYDTMDSEKREIMWIGDGNGISLMGDLYGAGSQLLNGSFDGKALVLAKDNETFILNRTTSKTDFGIPYGMVMEFSCVPTDEGAGNYDDLMNSVKSVIYMRMADSGYPDTSVEITKDNTIRVMITDTTDESLTDLLNVHNGKLEFVYPDGEVFMTGDDVKSAAYRYDANVQGGPYLVDLNFTRAGSEIFAKATEKVISLGAGNSYIEIRLDGETLMLPRVEKVLNSGSVYLTGLGSAERARYIAAQIQLGATPVELKLIRLVKVYDVAGANGITVKDRERRRDSQVIVLKLGDVVRSKLDVEEQIDDELKNLADYGYDTTDKDIISEVKDLVISELKEQMVMDAKIRELKLDELTEEDEARILEDAQETYDYYTEMVKAYYLSDSGLEGDALDEAAHAMLNSFDSYVENARTEYIDNRLKEYIIRDVAVTEDEIIAEYDSRVAADQEKYAEDAGAWTDAYMSGTRLYYTPSGVRLVKLILIRFRDEDQAAISEARNALADVLYNPDATETEKDEVQAALASALAAGYANIDAEADEVLAEIANGADWDTLMAEKTQDPGMQGYSDTAVNGYAVAAGMTRFDPVFVDAAMALNAVGDVTDKVPSEIYGYYIIKYVNNAEVGAVSLDSVRDAINDELLTSRQDTFYENTVQSWIDSADFEENLDVLKY